MTSILSPGTQVKHPLHHRGIVVDSRYRGYEYLVRFGHDSRWVRGSDLEDLDKKARPVRDIERVRRARIERTRADNPERIAELRMLFEAFRLGIVPHGDIVDWTVGRDVEVKAIRDWLADQAYGSLVMEGAYGTGKTHLLEVLYAKAIEMGYAVTRIGFDPSESPAAFPKRVYRRATQWLRVPYEGRVLGFREALRIAARNAKGPLLEDHPYLGAAVARLQSGHVSEAEWEELEGRESASTLVGGMYDYTTSANIYCNLLSGLGWLFVQELGALGFLLLMDEVETAQTYLYSYHWRRGLNFFQGVSMTANDHPELLDEKVVRKKEAHRGEETGLVYSGHNPVPYLYRVPSYLKVVFAITPGAFTKQFLKWHPEQPVLTLSTLGGDSLRKLFEQLADAYEVVHDVSLPAARRDAVYALLRRRTQDGTTRAFIKAMVEVMDFIRFHPGKPLSTLAEDDGW